ncbi:hypothetical protein [Chromobacterium paludis]|uniref:Uncharacterized protein n=1 Tax=Chromobacterium paludis TaxID=2605945 RepID=A0A5C1DH80_9NEIS|nr:hypothetical protein [Chromobacterium paludis]QEL54958.1 hypothetical protein FYK34_04955 [Chromobacterium paludis]
MKNLITRLRGNRKLSLTVLIASTLLFMAMSVLWRGGQVESVLLRLFCPVLLLLAMGGQLLSLLALLQKPRK